MRRQSKKYSLNWRDIAKGVLSAVLVPAIMVVEQSLQAGEIKINWHTVVGASVAGLLAYLKITFFSGDKK